MWDGPDNLSAKTENRCYGSRTESSATTPSVSETVGKDIITVDHELRREFRDLCVVTSKLAFT
jgi:adenosyl cobinamide kinase/adenosyl cobinamide phosphate guanylyltransferase